MKKLLFILCLVLISCKDQNQSNTISSLKVKDPLDLKIEKQQRRLDSIKTAQKRWSYFENKDQMDGSIDKGAMVFSQEYNKLNFPYDSAQAAIVIYKVESKYMVLIQCTDGQFDSDYSYNGKIRVKFNNELKEFDVGAVDGAIYIKKTKDFINNIKVSDSAKIELNFYQEPILIFNFNTSNFKEDVLR